MPSVLLSLKCLHLVFVRERYEAVETTKWTWKFEHKEFTVVFIANNMKRYPLVKVLGGIFISIKSRSNLSRAQRLFKSGHYDTTDKLFLA